MRNSTPLMRPRQAAEHLGVAVASLAKWRVSGDGPEFLKLGAAVRYRMQDLDAWVESRRARSTAETTGRH